MIDINLGDFDIDDDFISEEKYLINISVNSRNKEVHIHRVRIYDSGIVDLELRYFNSNVDICEGYKGTSLDTIINNIENITSPIPLFADNFSYIKQYLEGLKKRLSNEYI